MGGMSTEIIIDNGDATFKSSQDCTKILEHTKRLHNEGIHGGDEMRHAARIPQVIVEQYLNQNGILFSEFMSNEVHIKRMLNDPALAGFRVWAGRV